MGELRELYVTSFKELRLADPTRPKDFKRQLYNIQKRHMPTNILKSLVSGFKKYAQVDKECAQVDKLDEAQINEWLDRFFLLRVSTTMLTSHYLQLISQNEKPRFRPEHAENINPYQSWINPQCRPDKIASHAISVVRKMCSQQYGCAPEINISVVASQPFPIVPQYLYYMISEVLKNAVRATVEQHLNSTSHPMPPIALLLSGDANTTCIRISDQAGGIPVDRLAHIWSYVYSIAKPATQPATGSSVEPIDMRNIGNVGNTDEDKELFRSQFGGLGCGLPLSRLYARYLGGNVELQTMPRFGTNVYIYLNRLGNSAEDLSVP